MKTYVITVSKTFPATHKRKGENTYFVEKLFAGLADRNESFLIKKDFTDYDWYEYYNCTIPKIHTIRANYRLWQKRFEQIDAGKACLSLRYWSGKPYRSKQAEIARLTKEDGIGIEMLRIPSEEFMGYDFNVRIPYIPEDGRINLISVNQLSRNDGLSFDDFKEWFRDYDLTKDLAIIHFTKFRYLYGTDRN